MHRLKAVMGADSAHSLVRVRGRGRVRVRVRVRIRVTVGYHYHSAFTRPFTSRWA